MNTRAPASPGSEYRQCRAALARWPAGCGSHSGATSGVSAARPTWVDRPLTNRAHLALYSGTAWGRGNHPGGVRALSAPPAVLCLSAGLSAA